MRRLGTSLACNQAIPGKVPIAHLKRVYGRSVMADLVQKQIEEANKKIVDDGQLRLAMQPKIELSKEQKDIEAEARKAEEEVKVQERRADRFDLGEVMLEAALVICSITLLTKKRMFWVLGTTIGVCATT